MCSTGQRRHRGPAEREFKDQGTCSVVRLSALGMRCAQEAGALFAQEAEIVQA